MCKKISQWISQCWLSRTTELDDIAIKYYNDIISSLTISYRELFIVAQIVCDTLLEAHIEHGIILLDSNETIFTVPVMLGILQSNNSFFICDTKWPKEMIVQFINELKPRACIFDKYQYPSGYNDILSNVSVTSIYKNQLEICQINSSDYILLPDIAYIVASSGTTGVPKLIYVSHDCILPNLLQLRSIFDVKREDYIFRATPLTFDPSIVDIFIGLSSSACLVTFSSTIRQSPKLVAGVLADSRCTVVQMTPSFYRQIRGHCLLNSVQTLIFGGEQFPYADKDLMSLIENGKKLINIYGITEMSCWASYHFVTLENLRTGRIPIGEPLNDTKLTIKPSDDCLSLFDLLLESDTRWTQTGLHNDKQIFSFATNDIVEHDNGSIYYVGRKTFTQKRMGVMVSVEYIEKTALQSNLVSECGGFFKEDGTLILLGSFTTDDGPSKLSEYLQTHLPPHFIPNKIRRSYSNLPLNENGKIDRSQLARLYSTETDEFGLDIPLIIDTIWKEILHKESDNTANFISDGGNSLLALTFVENLRSQSKTIDSTTALDILLHNTKNDLVNYLKMGKQVENNVLNEPKDYVSKENIHQLDEIISIQRCSKIFVHNYGEKMFEYCLSLKEHGIDIKHKRITKATTKTTELQLKWKSSLEKCIDASPLIVIINDKQQLVIVGSHAHLLNAYEIENGTLIWSFKTNDRIEAGATLSRTGEYVLVGDYSGMLYIIDCHYGQLYGTYQCGGLIKTIPCAHRSLDLVYVGSHDHYLHAINIQNRNSTCVWKYFLDSSCASSPPLSADDSCLYVATLKGEVYSLDANTGICKWKSAVSKPIFSSILVWNELLIFGCVDQNIYCLNEKTGEQKWYLSIGGPIFSSPSAVYDITLDRVLITFGCHDKKVYAVQIIHNQPLIAWEHSFESTVYASLFGFERHDQWLTIAASTDGCLQILDTHTGSMLCETKLNGEIFSSPVYFNDYVFVGSRDNFLYCFRLQ